MKKLALVFLIIFTSCKTTNNCDAYVEEDIHKQHIENQKKYCSIETIK